MEEYTNDISEMERSILLRIAAVAEETRKVIPDIYAEAVGEHNESYDPDLPSRFFFRGGNTIFCQKLVGLILSKLQEELPHTRGVFSAQEPHPEPSISLNKLDIEQMTHERLHELDTELKAIATLSREQLIEQLEQFDLASVKSEEISTDKSKTAYATAKNLLEDMKLFIYKAQFDCTPKLKCRHDTRDGDKLVFEFISNDEDVFNLAATIASKLEDLGSIQLEPDLPEYRPCKESKIVLKREEIEALMPRDIERARRNLQKTIYRQSPEALRKEVADLDMRDHLHLMTGQPRIHKKSI